MTRSWQIFTRCTRSLVHSPHACDAFLEIFNGSADPQTNYITSRYSWTIAVCCALLQAVAKVGSLRFGVLHHTQKSTSNDSSQLLIGGGQRCSVARGRMTCSMHCMAIENGKLGAGWLPRTAAILQLSHNVPGHCTELRKLLRQVVSDYGSNFRFISCLSSFLFS